jgi:biopolymer transport protein ExbD
MIDLTPLIDVIFQMVIFFMISSVFNTAPGIELELPESATSEAVKVSEVRITVTGPDEVYLNLELVPLSSLGKTIRDRTAEGRFAEDTVILVEGGRTVPYETIVSVLDEVRMGGIEAVNLITAPVAENP